MKTLTQTYTMKTKQGHPTYLPKVKPSDSTSITDSGETEEEMNEKEK